MNAFLLRFYDKLLLAFACALCAASAVWSYFQRAGEQGLHAAPPGARPAANAHVSAAVREPDVATPLWEKPPAQSHGSGWIYEVFTPPVIYYNSYARSFTVTPPVFAGEFEHPFGLEVLDIKREFFRLQLVGYYGAPGDYSAAFTSPLEGATLFGRAGQRFATLGLTLMDFQIRRVPVANVDRLPVFEVAAFAVLVDETDGALVELDSRARKLTDTAVVVLRPEGTTGPGRALHEGESLDVNFATYKVERIRLDPPEVVIVKSEPGLPQPETRLLKPSKPAAPGTVAEAAAEPASDRPARSARPLASSQPQP